MSTSSTLISGLLIQVRWLHAFRMRTLPIQHRGEVYLMYKSATVSLDLVKVQYILFFMIIGIRFSLYLLSYNNMIYMFLIIQI